MKHAALLILLAGQMLTGICQNTTDTVCRTVEVWRRIIKDVETGKASAAEVMELREALKEWDARRIGWDSTLARELRQKQVWIELYNEAKIQAQAANEKFSLCNTALRFSNMFGRWGVPLAVLALIAGIFIK